MTILMHSSCNSLHTSLEQLRLACHFRILEQLLFINC
jgi:hypothetical protein